MIHASYPANPTHPANTIIHRALSSRAFRSLLAGLAITLMLTAIEVLVVLVLNPFSIFAKSANHSLSLIIILLVHIPLLLLIPLVELLAFSLLAFIAIKPLAIRAYLRDISRDLEQYRKAYTQLSSLDDPYETHVAYYQHDSSSANSPQEHMLSILELAHMPGGSCLLPGAPGAGKTLALHVCQFMVSRERSMVARGHRSIPLYIPLKDYGLFLKAYSPGLPTPAQEDNDRQGQDSAELLSAPSLLDFLAQSNLPGMHRLRSYLPKLVERGQILFLCDDLDEVDPHLRSRIASELAELLLITQNLFIITCREGDEQDQQELLELLQQGHIQRALLLPLQAEQVRAFVERYVKERDGHWQYTAGQIMQVIEQGRLRYLCTNPLTLFTLLAIIAHIGINPGTSIGTRGLLWRMYIDQVIQGGQQPPTRRSANKTEQLATSDVVELLGRIACVARLSGKPDAILLPGIDNNDARREGMPGGAVAGELQGWLEQQPFDSQSIPTSSIAAVLQEAQNAALLEIAPVFNDGQHWQLALSFRHELVAAYCLAEYLLVQSRASQFISSSLMREIIANAVYWSLPVTLWAGLSDQPLMLAGQFALLGKNNPAFLLQALTLSLICVGVSWVSPQAGALQEQPLPAQLAALLENVLRDHAARQQLARIFTHCIEQGAQELYQSLFPLIMLDGADELLLLLDRHIVPDLLFGYLRDTIDIPAYDEQVRQVCRILWRFSGSVVPQAAELSQPAPGRSSRLRAAAINILGGTNHADAVAPLVACLVAPEPLIVERAIHALSRLGPELALDDVLAQLEEHLPGREALQIHRAILATLERFLLLAAQPAESLTVGQVAGAGSPGSKQDIEPATAVQRKPGLAPVAYQRILEALISILFSKYAAEPEIQQQARQVLVRAEAALAVVPEKAIPLLLRYLSAGDEILVDNIKQVLREIGSAATSFLLVYLDQRPAELVRARIIEILKDMRDPQALPAILDHVADASPLVQQQVAEALRVYRSESIPGLIDVTLSHPDMRVAERAASILESMGEVVVEPVIQALFPIVAGRTRLLVQVLEQVHDPRAVPALIDLLKALRQVGMQAGISLSPADILLVIAVIRALGQFPDRRVVLPLIQALSLPQVQLYEEAIDALSSLGEVAFGGLLAALDTREETATTQRARRALLGMVPFPGKALIEAWRGCSDAQAEQIMLVFKAQGADAAHILVQYLFHEHERVRRYIYQTLAEMPGPVVVPALLEMLDRPAWRNLVTRFLLRYPEAIPPLVNLLRDPDRAAVAATILQQFGPGVITALVPALDDAEAEVQEYARRIVVALVRQQPAAIVRVVHLFGPSLPLRAHETLMEILTDDLPDIAIPALLQGLEDAYLIDDASEALKRLAQRRDWQAGVLNGLLKALRMEERRRGAQTALIKLGALAVRGVGELITDQDRAVAEAAQHILSEIGVPALSFIWAAHSDTGNRARREAAMRVFQMMSTEVIKDALVELLDSNRPEDMAMAMTLLLERIHDEATLPHVNQEMIPALLGYVEIHEQEHTSLRIIALLLLLGGELVINHLAHELYTRPEHHQRLAYAFLFLGEGARDALRGLLNDPGASTELQAEVMGVLGLLQPDNDVYEYARSLSRYGLSPDSAGIASPHRLAIALRALGSLLARGEWDVTTLQNMRRLAQKGSPEYELYTVLLGWRFAPEIAKLERDLQSERDARKNEIMNLTARIVQDQSRINQLENALERLRHEHGIRSDELDMAMQEREDLRESLNQALRENQSLRDQIAQLQAYNTQLLQELEDLRSSQEE